MPRIPSGSFLCLLLVILGASHTLGQDHDKKCRFDGTRAVLAGERVCLPEPSPDLLRVGFAFEVSQFSGRPYADVVEDVVQLVRALDALPTEVAPGAFPLNVVPGQLNALKITAPQDQVFANMTITNQDPQENVLVRAEFGDGFLQSRLPPGERVALGRVVDSVTIVAIGLRNGVVLVNVPAVQDPPPPPPVPTCHLLWGRGFSLGACLGTCIEPPHCKVLARSRGFLGFGRQITSCGCRECTFPEP